MSDIENPVVVPRKTFADRLTGLIRRLGEIENERNEIRAELSRILTTGVTDMLEAVMVEERHVCQSCNLDHAESQMADAEHCFDCARLHAAKVQRLELAKKEMMR